MERLLNKLIKKGWKPRNKDYLVRLYVKYWDIQLRRGESYAPTEEKRWAIMSKRELVSMESWLRQFVCQNDMVDKKKIWMFYEMFLEENWMDAKDYRPFSLVERLIIESALCDEDKLEEYLLSNIKVDGTTM